MIFQLGRKLISTHFIGRPHLGQRGPFASLAASNGRSSKPSSLAGGSGSFGGSTTPSSFFDRSRYLARWELLSLPKWRTRNSRFGRMCIAHRRTNSAPGIDTSTFGWGSPGAGFSRLRAMNVTVPPKSETNRLLEIGPPQMYRAR